MNVLIKLLNDKMKCIVKIHRTVIQSYIIKIENFKTCSVLWFNNKQFISYKYNPIFYLVP